MITLNPITMINIAKTALYWYVEHEAEGKEFNEQKTKCFEIIQELDKTKWDEDAKIFIDELPF